jgi:hypothetical protein
MNSDGFFFVNSEGNLIFQFVLLAENWKRQFRAVRVLRAGVELGTDRLNIIEETNKISYFTTSNIFFCSLPQLD